MLSSPTCAAKLVRQRLAEDLQFVNRRESRDPSSDKIGNLLPVIPFQVDAIRHRFSLNPSGDISRGEDDWQSHHRFRNDQRKPVHDMTFAERWIREEAPHCL
jgi:hypothetical protein